jgi:uncharacterized membrane protein YfcA
MLVAIAAIIVCVSAFFQGLLGFGISLTTMPFLLQILPIQEVVPIVVILNVVTNLIALVKTLKKVVFKRIWVLLFSSLLFAPLGVYSLIVLDASYLKIATGVLVLSFSLFLIGKSMPIRNENLGYAIAGSLSGFLNGAISIYGPPVILFLSNQRVEKEVFRANLIFSGLALNAFTLCSLYIGGLVSENVLRHSVLLMPALLFGVGAGMILAKKFNEKIFRTLSLILMVIAGVWLLIDSIFMS